MEDSLIEQGFEIVNAQDAIPDKAIKSIKSDDAQVQQSKCETSGGDDDDEEEEEDQEYLIGQSSFAIVDHIPQSDDAEPTTTKNKEAEQGSSVSNPGAKETGTETETVGKASEKEEEKEQPQSSTSPKPRKAKAIVEIVSEGAVSSTKSTTSANKVQAKAKDSSSNSVKKVVKASIGARSTRTTGTLCGCDCRRIHWLHPRDHRFWHRSTIFDFAIAECCSGCHVWINHWRNNPREVCSQITQPCIDQRQRRIPPNNGTSLNRI